MRKFIVIEGNTKKSIGAEAIAQFHLIARISLKKRGLIAHLSHQFVARTWGRDEIIVWFNFSLSLRAVTVRQFCVLSGKL